MTTGVLDEQAPLSRDEVLRLVRERITRFAASRVGPDKAEDLAQEALILLIQKYPHLVSPNDLVPLAIQIVRFKMYSERRKVIRHGEQQVGDNGFEAWRDGGLDPEGLADRRQRADRLRAAARQLKSRCRELFRLKLDGLAFSEIQRELGAASINTVYTWDRRCRQELLALMGGSYEL